MLLPCRRVQENMLQMRQASEDVYIVQMSIQYLLMFSILLQ